MAHSRSAISDKIFQLRRHLKTSQSELARPLGTSAMAISRWERGESLPPSRYCIRLGTLAESDLCRDFWHHAGLTRQDVIRVFPAATNLRRISPAIQLVRAGPKI